MNIFDFALQMEKEATDFYAGLSRQVAGKGPQQIFADLASDHAERRRYLESVRIAFGSTSGLNSQDLEEGVSPWHGLPQETAMAADFDDEAAYRFALKLEEMEARCYEDLLLGSRAREAKSVLRRITEEESRHLERIRDLYDFINAPNQYLAWGEFSNLEEFHQFGRDVD
jgi:rubrerythrin